MRVLVTGIDGFVGSHAAELLSSMPDVELHGIVQRRGSHRNIEHLRPSPTLHQADITDRRRVQAIIEQLVPDRILHIAGQAFVPASLQDPMTTFQSNLVGGLSILEAARLQKLATGKSPSVLVVTSGEVYGRVPPEQLPLTEVFPLSPKTPYAASKASLDLIAQQYRDCFGVDVVIVRPFNHAGPRQNPAFVISDFSKQFAEIMAGMREPTIHVGNIGVKRDFTDVRDVVRAYWKLFERSGDETIFNVSSCNGIEIGELLRKLQEITGVDVNIVHDSDRFRPYDLPIVIASYARLERATGWSPQIPLRKTLEDTYAYWLSELKNALSKTSSATL